MEPEYRAEVRAFVLASEKILSRVFLVPPMNEKEREIVDYYASCLIERCRGPQTLPSDTKTNSLCP
jgi:hypothetical protein